MSKESVEKIESNTLRILDSNVQEDLQIIDLAPLITNYLEDETIKKYEDIKNMLNNINIPYSEDHKLVRGLEYYNHLTFEFVSDGVVIGGGGRYNK